MQQRQNQLVAAQGRSGKPENCGVHYGISGVVTKAEETAKAKAGALTGTLSAKR
jgi:hypothetical protein